MNAPVDLKEQALTWAEAGLFLEVRIADSVSLMPAGRNGPYLDLESPLRNTAHWLVSFSVAYELSGESRFEEAAHRLARFLLEDNRYLVNGVPVQRQRDTKDWANGVIGTAWLAEALNAYGRVFSAEQSISRARQLVDQLPFDSRTGGWRVRDPLLGPGKVDRTYNHQSWLAAVRAELFGGGDEYVQLFLEKSASRNFRVDADGLIEHRMPLPKPGMTTARVYGSAALRRLGGGAYKKKLLPFRLNKTERARGYQLYVLYSLARLLAAGAEHPFLRSGAIRRALSLAASKDFVADLANNPFTYPYNAPGFEFPLVRRIFSDVEPRLDGQIEDLGVRTQIDQTYDESSGLFSRGTYDPLTLSARLYELMLGLSNTTGAPASGPGGSDIAGAQ